MAAIETHNLVTNADLCEDGNALMDWSYWSPRPEIALDHTLTHEGGRRLVLRATGDKRAFGCWKGKAEMEVGKWYKASVKARIHEIERTELAIFAQVAQHYLLPVKLSNGELLLERTFKHTKPEDGNDIELYLRAAEMGSVEWYDPKVVTTSEPERRMARVATARFGVLDAPITPEMQLKRISEKLDLAGEIGADIVCLPEFSPLIGTGLEGERCLDLAEESPDGPACTMLAAKAREHGMYVIAGVLDRRGPYVFNTAVLVDRNGELVGRYDKTHLTFAELKWGISCGGTYPVFDLDFGRIGIHICYDEWFPEVARNYAYQGVEILFLPVAGGKPVTWRTRALDNRVYFVSSSITPPSMIIDSSGEIIAQTHGDGLAYADLDMSQREVNWYKDPTIAYGMPCIVPQMRHVLDHELIDELHSRMISDAIE
jgi:predicted amidohydrolase